MFKPVPASARGCPVVVQLPSECRAVWRPLAFTPILVCCRRPEDRQARACQNPHVEPEPAIIDVPEIELDTPLHLLDASRFAAVSVDLRPAGDARLHMVAERVRRDQR